MKKVHFLGIFMLYTFSSFAQSTQFTQRTTIKVETLNHGKNRVQHEGLEYEVYYQNGKITKVKRLHQKGKPKVYKLKDNSPTVGHDIEVCWEDEEKKMSICIKCTCKRQD